MGEREGVSEGCAPGALASTNADTVITARVLVLGCVVRDVWECLEGAFNEKGAGVLSPQSAVHAILSSALF